MKTKISVLILVFAVSMMMAAAVGAADDGCSRCHSDIAENFSTSLHHTGSGMLEEYERGAAGYFGIDMPEYYEKFNCNKCHAVSCTSCHPGTNMYESHLYEVSIETCSKCHAKKQTSTYAGDFPMNKAPGPNADIHYERGLLCQDCHASSELHGTGVKYDTQLEAVNVECVGCHKDLTESRSHTVHDDKLECISCHTGWMLTCENCHLSTRKGMTVTADKFLLGINKDSKVTTFLIMDVTTGNGTEIHHAYGEWNSHTITAEGRECAFCHENPDVLGQGLSGQIVGEGGQLIPQETIDRILSADTSESEKAGLIARILSLFGIGG